MNSLYNASKIYVESSTVQDGDYNTKFVEMTHALERKTETLLELYALLCERAPKAGREVQVLPWLHDLYTIANSFFKMCATEATRVGILKRKLEIDEATQFSTTHELINLIEV